MKQPARQRDRAGKIIAYGLKNHHCGRIMANTSLKGKIVFVTGASTGIGAATAFAFAGEGARLLLAARRAGKLAEVASLALERGAQAVHSFSLDVRNRHAVQRSHR